MKRPLSMVREKTPFATPPRVLVVADASHTGDAVALADALEDLGADTEVRFSDAAGRGHVPFSDGHSDAVIVAGTQGYQIARHHPILEHVRSFFAARRRW